MEEFLRARVPWTTEPSLTTKTEEVGIDFDKFIEGLKNDKSDAEMAQEFNVTEKTIYHLREHFMTRGIVSTMGQD